MADERKYYVLCDQNCKFESMTKEQILTAIVQAVENGTFDNIDTGFVTTLKTINNKSLKFFVGTQNEYDSLSSEEKEGVFAIITNDTYKDDILNAIVALEGITESLDNRVGVVENTISHLYMHYAYIAFPLYTMSNLVYTKGNEKLYICANYVSPKPMTLGTQFLFGTTGEKHYVDLKLHSNDGVKDMKYFIYNGKSSENGKPLADSLYHAIDIVATDGTKYSRYFKVDISDGYSEEFSNVAIY